MNTIELKRTVIILIGSFRVGHGNEKNKTEIL